MNKAKAYRELQKRQLRRTDACLLALYSPDFIDGGVMTSRLGGAPDMLRRPHHRAGAAAGAARASTASAAFPARTADALRGGRVVIANEDLRSAAIGEPQPRAGASSSAAADTRLTSRDDDRPATTTGIVTGTGTFASAMSQPQAVSARQDLAAPQHTSLSLKNGRRLSAASGSGSSARSNDNVKGPAGPSGSIVSADGNNNNSNNIDDPYKFSPRASTDLLAVDGARDVVVAQFPSASKMRQILSEIDSHQHHGLQGDEKPTGIMKKPPAAPPQWRNHGVANGNVNGAAFVASAVVVSKPNAGKGVAGRATEKDGSAPHGPFGAAAAARRANMAKQVSFIDAQSGDKDSLTLAGVLSNGAGSFSAGSHDQPLMLTSRNLEMYTSLLASSALSQPSAAQEDRVSQWVKEHQQQVHAFRDVAEVDEHSSSAAAATSDGRDADAAWQAAVQIEQKHHVT